MWCNARKGAVWFYQRLGFVTVSEEFEIAPIGPHYVMEIDLVTGLTDRNGQKVNTSNATAEPPPSR